MAKNHHSIGCHSQSESFQRLDGRGRIARRLKAVTSDLTAALGGPEGVTPQQKLIIDQCAVQTVRLTMLANAFLVSDEQVPLETERRYAWHSNALVRNLVKLGLHQVAKSEPSLSDYLSGRRA
ncbi:MAG: hypothetical protein O7A65_07155 [Proteobacteria bacterium]|nr:hypothetical protein [Pseudomonadota bacterium]